MILKPFRDDEYIDNNPYLGWMLAAKLAEWLGMEVRVAEEGKFIRFIIELPSGEVTPLIPLEYAEGNWKKFEGKLVPAVDDKYVYRAVYDCLVGVLTHRHILIIPEQGNKTE